MREGKVPGTILRRSVLRPLSDAGVLAGFGIGTGEDFAFLPFADASVCGTVGGPYDRTFAMMAASVANRLCIAGLEAEALTLDLLLPVAWEETQLRDLLREVAAACREFGLTIRGGDLEVSGAVARPVVSLTARGSAKEGMAVEHADAPLRPAAFVPGLDLVMTRQIGLAGTAVLAHSREALLRTRYPFSLVDEAKGFDRYIFVRDAVRACREYALDRGREVCSRSDHPARSLPALWEVAQGGIFAALWEMAEDAGVGLDADMKKIPVRQETVEICEFFDLNPYELYGQGALLAGTEHGEALAGYLNARGIPAAVIGRTTAGNDRILRNGEEIRYLNRPAQDALWRMAERK